MEYLLLNVLAMSRGSVDFAKKLLEQRNAPPSPTSPGNNKPDGWTCKLCRPMPIDHVCCKRLNCITQFQVFNNICPDRDILEMCTKVHCNIWADEFHFLMESFRNSAYLQFILWCFGQLWRANRLMVPSCAVLSIWWIYPSLDGHCMGYRSS